MTSDTRSVLIAVDGSPDSDRIIQAATQYVDRATCHIRLAVVVPALEGELAAVRGDTLGNWPIREMQAAFESEMAETARSHAANFDVAVEDVVVLFGRPAVEIAAYCDSNGIDLVVLGLHRTAAQEIGSTTLGLLQRGSCDVMAVRLGERSAR